MKCPRCPEAVLEEREREGITIDACRTCHGIWLDRGEIERLLARAREDEEEIVARREQRALRAVGSRFDDRPRRDDDHDHRRRFDHDDDRDRYGREHGRYGHRRKRWFEALGDIFD